MNLKLKITQKENANMSDLIKLMCTLQCRITVDISEGDISIEDLEDKNIEKVIDSINNAFNIVGIVIIPTEIPATEIPTAETPIVETIKPDENSITAESLEIAKIEFSNQEVEEQLNKLMRIIYWAMYYNKAYPRDICQYLMSTGNEIAMRYNPKEIIPFSIGDIVVCNYGTHLSGEISGGYVHAIVCNIDTDGTFYAAPITKTKHEKSDLDFMPFEANVDIIYTDNKYTDGSVILKKGKYIRAERIKEVAGKTKPEFFNRLLSKLPEIFNFSHNDNAEIFSEDNSYIDNQNEDSETITSDTTSNSPDTNIENSKSSCTTAKISVEDYILEFFKTSLESFDKSKTIEEQIDIFLDCIGFQTTEKIIKQSFIAACKVKRINYENISLEVHNVYPQIQKELIKTTIKDEFKKWLIQYPELKEMYPTLSLMVLLKIFTIILS